jgi:hypothetical protein
LAADTLTQINNTMNPKLRRQVNLMQEAIAKVSEIDRITTQFKLIDPDYANKRRNELAEDYAYIMSQLVANVVDDAGVKVIQHAHKNAVQIAEEVLS